MQSSCTARCRSTASTSAVSFARRRRKTQGRPQEGEPERKAHVRGGEPTAANRTLTRVIMDERGKDAWAAVAKHLDPKRSWSPTSIRAYDDFIGLVQLTRVNHSLRYQGGRQHEFERDRELLQPRRESLQGLQPPLPTKYLDWYMAMLSWKEDTRQYRPALGVRRSPANDHVTSDIAKPGSARAQNIADQACLQGDRRTNG
ncbi:transposase [Rhizobium etli]|uniref:transposase n=1 Tax=Rhizobium etli TaxID=29449 RepID=UPI00308456A7